MSVRPSGVTLAPVSNLSRACGLLRRRKPGEVAARHSCRAAGEGVA